MFNAGIGVAGKKLTELEYVSGADVHHNKPDMVAASHACRGMDS
jgi:hypothetical protein